MREERSEERSEERGGKRGEEGKRSEEISEERSEERRGARREEMRKRTQESLSHDSLRIQYSDILTSVRPRVSERSSFLKLVKSFMAVPQYLEFFIEPFLLVFEIIFP